MKYYQTPNTQIVRLSSGEVLQTHIEFTFGGSGNSGGEQGNAMAPRRAATPNIP